MSETPIADRRFLPTATGDRRFLPSVALVLGVIVTVALGYWGWYRARAGLPHGGEFLHRIYLTLQLFVLHPQDLPRHGWPWQLEVARFTAAAVVATATVTVLVSVFRRPLDELRLRALARHVIVCGGGVHGHRLASNLSRRRSVVTVDIDAKAPGVVGLRGRRHHHLVADAVERRTLERAGVGRARAVVAVTGDDVVNSQIASTLRAMPPRRGRTDRLRVLVQTEDPVLASVLEDLDRSGNLPPRAPRFETFSANGLAASALLGGLDSSPVGGPPRNDGSEGHCHVLIAGDHPLLEAVLLTVLRDSRARRLRGDRSALSPRVTLIGPRAVEDMRRITRKWRMEPTAIELRAADVDAQDETLLASHRWLHEWREAQQAFVACELETDSIRLAIGLSRVLGREVKVTRIRTQPRS